MSITQGHGGGTTSGSLRKEVAAAAFSFYLLLAVPLILILAILHWADAYTERRQWAARQTAALRVASDSLFEPLREAASDVSLLSEIASEQIDDLRPDGGLAREFARFARHRMIYDQIRVIGMDGQERVRVNFRGGRARTVPADELQNKAHRFYFSQSIELERGGLYISRFDLNEEHRQIEIPHLPTIRLAEPIFDEAGQKRGILVLNLLGESILDLLAARDRNSALSYWLIDASGHWIFSDKPERAWGVQLPHGRTITEVDGTSDLLMQPEGGLFEAPSGQFAFQRLRLDSNSFRAALAGGAPDRVVSEENYWVLSTVVFRDQLYSSSQRRLQVMLAIGALVLLALAPLSVLWGRWRVRVERQKWQARIYAQALEQSDELVYVTTPEAVILFANSAVERLTGYTRDEIIGNTPRLFKSGRQTRVFYDSMWNKVRKGETVRAVFVNRRKDGALFYENKIISPLVDEAGKVTHLVSIGRDITVEQERQEREMRLADQLSSQLSHHFNNLLSPIINYAEMAADTAEENAQNDIRADIEKVLTGANRIRDVLVKISAMSLGAQLSQGVQVVGSLARGIVKIEQATLPREIELKLLLDEHMDRVGVEFDDLALIVSELISNARDAVEGHGTITISAGLVSFDGDVSCSTCGTPLSGGFVDLAVSDTGRGMSASELSRAFDPFYSTKQSSKLVGETLGIGLPRVRNRVHANGGHIVVDTEPGEGTTIHLFCPARDIASEEPARRKRADA